MKKKNVFLGIGGSILAVVGAITYFLLKNNDGTEESIELDDDTEVNVGGFFTTWANARKIAQEDGFGTEENGRNEISYEALHDALKKRDNDSDNY